MTSLDRAQVRNIRRALASMSAIIHGLEVQLADALDERTPAATETWVPLDVAAKRSGEKADTIRYWCRDAKRNPGLGRRDGKRWLVNMSLLNQRVKPK